LLAAPKTAVLCSRACPGEVILRLFDLAKRLRDSDLAFIGGFHTPAERDFLHHLLPGSCRLIVCPARRLEGMRVPAAWQKAIAAERILLLCPFTAESQRRQSARLAERRNELVVGLADQILLLHAAPNSQTERLLRAAKQQPLLTLALDDETLCRRLI
jgi:predicted Rossmann fold nucleotide-binding protein DprA/Smf involved in DNA uptake